MVASCPSLTARRAAELRFLHQMLDEPRVFDDPLALDIIGIKDRAPLRAVQQKLADTPASDFLRAFVAARSRYTEDSLGEAIQRGLRQYVILGAGLDTFAYRNPYTYNGLRVFEVDQPSTQSWKQSLLAESGISIPPSLTFVPVDFETETLEGQLRQADFDCNKPAFFSLLGVTPYLTRNNIFATLRFIASMNRGSCVVLDYVVSPSLLNEQQRSAFVDLSRRVAKVHEPWHTFFDPSSLMAELAALGFREVEDLGPDEINARYFANRKDGLHVRGFGRIIRAAV